MYFLTHECQNYSTDCIIYTLMLVRYLPLII
jgi:hypothetical protein